MQNQIVGSQQVHLEGEKCSVIEFPLQGRLSKPADFARGKISWGRIPTKIAFLSFTAGEACYTEQFWLGYFQLLQANTEHYEKYLHKLIPIFGR